MLGSETGCRDLVFKCRYEDSWPFLVYHSAALGDPPDHAVGKWYYLRYPGADRAAASGPFDSPEEAARAAQDDRDWPGQAARLRPGPE